MKDPRIYHRIYFSNAEDRFFQNIANMFWREGLIKKPTITKLSKLALNRVGRQYIEQIEQLERKEKEAKSYLAKQRSPIKTGPVNSSNG